MSRPAFQSGRGLIRFTAEGSGGPALRLLHLPLDDASDGSVLFAVDDAAAAGGVAAGGGELETIAGLLDLVPARLALVDRDGRLLALNAALRQSLGSVTPPRYPGDLVVADDKAALADHVRRLSGARALSGDIAVRLAQSPDDPVTVTASSVRGLGAAAVLLAVRDDGPAAPAARRDGAAEQDGGGRPPGRRHRARLQQPADRDIGHLRPDADAPPAGRQRLRRHPAGPVELEPRRQP